MVLKILLNTILVSIPEETAIFIITCLFAKQKCFISMITYKYYLKYIMPTIVIPSLLSNMIRYGLDAQHGILSVLPPVIMLLSMFYIFEYTNKMMIIRTVIGFSLGILIVGVTQLGYVTLILKILGLSLYSINNNILINFAFSIPSMILIYIIVTAIVINCDEGINVIGEIFSKKNMMFNIPMIIVNLTLTTIVNLVLYQNILSGFSMTIQIMITAVMLSIPSINIFVIILNVINSIKKYRI